MSLQPRRPVSAARRAEIAEGRAAAVARHKNTQGRIPDRYAAFVSGDITVDDLDDDEIMRGQIRAKDGSFKGGVPKMIPRQFALAIQERQRQLMQQEIGGMVLMALKTLQEVMDKPFPQPGDNAKVNAAKLILERNLGKVPDTINLNAEVKTWEQKVSKSIKVVYKREDKGDGTESPADE